MTAASLLLARARHWRPRMRLGPGGSIAAGFIALLIPITVFARLIASNQYDVVNLLAANLSPSSSHWFGTDSEGRDVLARVIVGSQTSLVGPLIVVVAGLVLGTTLAIVAAWHGGVLDEVIGRTADALFAFPSLLLAIIAAAMFGIGLVAPVVALAIAYTPYFIRVLRATALQQRSLPYVAALEVQGVSAWRICTRHLLPAMVPMILAQGATAFGYALIDLAAISYLGLGVSPPTPDWGLMVADGQTALLGGAPQESLFAGLAIAVTVLAFVALGSSITRALQRDAR